MRQWLSMFLIGSVIAACSVALLSAQQLPAQMTDEEIRTVLRERTEDPRKTVGIIVAVLDEKGNRVFSQGKPSLDSNQPLTADFLFKINSITKVFTSILLADMVERGEVGLDDPISKYLPESVRTPTRGGKEILLRHLATHTSGLTEPGNLTGRSEYTVQQMYTFLSRVEVTRDIGEEYEYSNVGMALLAHILSRKAGTDYGTLVRTRLLEPLKMIDTRTSLTAEMRARLPMGYTDGKPNLDTLDPYALFGGVGALYSTANDLLKFLEANLGKRPTALLPTLRKSHQSLGKAYNNVEIGLGWHITGQMVWHDGGGLGQRTFLGFNTQTGRGVAMFWNSMWDFSDIGIHLLDNAAPLRKALKPFPLAEKVLDSLTGQYQLEGPSGRTFTLRREGKQLFGQMGNDKFEILAASETELFFRNIDVELTVVRDEKGEVVRIVSSENGQQETARRIQ